MASFSTDDEALDRPLREVLGDDLANRVTAFLIYAGALGVEGITAETVVTNAVEGFLEAAEGAVDGGR